MNERTRQLWVQALNETTVTVDKIFGMTASQDIIMEKFAELVVKECCQKLESDGMVEVAIELKQHFGITE